MLSPSSKARKAEAWVSDRLDSIRETGFRLFQADRTADLARRKATFSMLDSKQETRQKQQVYKRIDATYDTLWIRYVYISQSEFQFDPSLRAQASLIRVSAITLEVRQSILDLFDLMARAKQCVSASASVSTVEFASKTLARLHCLVQMQEKLLELASDIKIKLAGQQLDEKMVKSDAGLRDVPEQTQRQRTTQLPLIVEAPILLLEERLQHFSSLDREALFTHAPQLRDLRGSLTILYQLRCDDTAVALVLADSLGDACFRLLAHGSTSLRNDFLPPTLAGLNAARANVWALLQRTHKVDMVATAQADANRQVHQRSPTNTQWGNSYDKSPRSATTPTAAAALAGSKTAPAATPATTSVAAVFQPIQKPTDTPPAGHSPAASVSSTLVVDVASSVASPATTSPATSPCNQVTSPASPSSPIGGGAVKIASPITMVIDSDEEEVVVVSAPTVAVVPQPSSHASSARVNNNNNTATPDATTTNTNTTATSTAATTAAATTTSTNTTSTITADAATTATVTATATASVEPVAAPVASSTPAVDEWVDARHGDAVFFYNTRTGVSSWTKPTATPAAAAAAAVTPETTNVTPKTAIVTPSTAAATSSSVLAAQAAKISESASRKNSLIKTTTAAATDAATSVRTCLFTDCSQPRFGTKPYCVAHLNQQ